MGVANDHGCPYPLLLPRPLLLEKMIELTMAAVPSRTTTATPPKP